MIPVPTFVHIPGGEVSLVDEGTGKRWNVPVAPFLISQHQVTRELYADVVSDTNVMVSRGRNPMSDVSWIDALQFCNRLSDREGRTPCYADFVHPDAGSTVCDFAADGFRLPTEAEWEYACRAGSHDVRYGELDAIAWHAGNSEHMLHDVGMKQTNAFGLYDTIGNVWEWCWDMYDGTKYGTYRVFRGGGFADGERGCRASCRRKSHPTFRIDDLGFRMARSR